MVWPSSICEAFWLRISKEPERVWVAACRTVAPGRRRHSRAAAALDLLAGSPLISPTTFAAAFGLAAKNAAALLSGFAQARIGSRGHAAVQAPAVRPRRVAVAVLPCRGKAVTPPCDLPAFSPIERQEFDYSWLEVAVTQLEQVRQTRRALGALAVGQRHHDPLTARHVSVADSLAAKFSLAT